MAATNALMSALCFVTSPTVTLDYGQELSTPGGGGIIAKDLRPPLWRASFETIAYRNQEANAVEALITQLSGSLSPFLAWDQTALYPASDPGGAVVGSSTVQIESIGADNKSFALKGLPAAYVLTRGDLVQVTGGSPQRVGLFRIMDGEVVANSSGVTAEFEVRPHLHAWMAEDDAVNLKKPAAEMLIVPDSFAPSPLGRRRKSFSFDAIQYLGG